MERQTDEPTNETPGFLNSRLFEVCRFVRFLNSLDKYKFYNFFLLFWQNLLNICWYLKNGANRLCN